MPRSGRRKDHPTRRNDRGHGSRAHRPPNRTGLTLRRPGPPATGGGAGRGRGGGGGGERGRRSCRAPGALSGRGGCGTLPGPCDRGTRGAEGFRAPLDPRRGACWPLSTDPDPECPQVRTPRAPIPFRLRCPPPGRPPRALRGRLRRGPLRRRDGGRPRIWRSGDEKFAEPDGWVQTGGGRNPRAADRQHTVDRSERPVIVTGDQTRWRFFP